LAVEPDSETDMLDKAGHQEPPEDLSEVMDFSSYDLRTTIRLIVLSGESRRVDVKRGQDQGSIFIDEGEIYRVVTGGRDGDEALFELLSWEKAVHADYREPIRHERNMRIPTAVFLDLMDKRTTSPE
jgi:hypothetical protein